MRPSAIARETLNAGRRALVGTVAGGVWVAWGLTLANAFTTPILVAFILFAALLLICCGYCILKGMSLKKHPLPRGPLNRGFLMVTMAEAVGVAGVIGIAQKTGRLEMLPDWIGIVVGLHFLGLAKVFRAPVYYLTGTAITVWCLLSWSLFRGHALALVVGIGIGTVLWVTSSFNLFRVLARVAEDT